MKTYNYERFANFSIYLSLLLVFSKRCAQGEKVRNDNGFNVHAAAFLLSTSHLECGFTCDLWLRPCILMPDGCEFRWIALAKVE